MASENVVSLPPQCCASIFTPPTMAPGIDDRARKSGVVVNSARLTTRTKTMSSHASGEFTRSNSSFHDLAAHTPSVLFAATPTPKTDAHLNLFHASAIRRAGFAMPECAPGGPSMSSEGFPSPQMPCQWVPMPMTMPLQAAASWMVQTPAALQGVLPVNQRQDVAYLGSETEIASNPQLEPDGLPSVGSAEHGSGRCHPCAWFWKPGRGCQEGANCDYCHLCPEGELKARKKAKVVAMRAGARETSSCKVGAAREHRMNLKLSNLIATAA